MLISFPGTLGIYQGEELGQTETDIEFHELRDLGYIDFWPDNKGRDGCRTPMVWNAEKPNAGFSTGEPWLPVKAPQAARAVDRQEAANDSVLHAYRAALTFRKSRDELRLGATDFPDLPEPFLAVRRTSGTKILTGIFNLSDQAQTLGVTGKTHAVGPQAATLVDDRLNLPAHGYIFLEEDGAVTYAADRETALA
jgi:alpha-glucosidase